MPPFSFWGPEFISSFIFPSHSLFSLFLSLSLVVAQIRGNIRSRHFSPSPYHGSCLAFFYRESWYLSRFCPRRLASCVVETIGSDTHTPRGQCFQVFFLKLDFSIGNTLTWYISTKNREAVRCCQPRSLYYGCHRYSIQDLRWTRKPSYTPIFAHRIRSWLLLPG